VALHRQPSFYHLLDEIVFCAAFPLHARRGLWMALGGDGAIKAFIGSSFLSSLGCQTAKITVEKCDG